MNKRQSNLNNVVEQYINSELNHLENLVIEPLSDLLNGVKVFQTHISSTYLKIHQYDKLDNSNVLIVDVYNSDNSLVSSSRVLFNSFLNTWDVLNDDDIKGVN